MNIKYFLSFRKTVFYIAVLCFSLCCFSEIFAQKTKEKQEDKNQKSKMPLPASNYQLHTVKGGETVYSISRQYGITTEELKSFNSLKGNDLKTGQTIKIPLKPNSVTANNLQQTTNVSQQTGNEFILYKIQKNNTLYSIAKQHNVTVQEIQVLNPFIEKGIKEGDELKIPVKKLLSDAQKTISSNEQQVNKQQKENVAVLSDSVTEHYIFHKLENNETLYSISKKYELPVSYLLAENPEIGNGLTLKAGQSIKIPRDTVSLYKKMTAVRKDSISTAAKHSDTLSVPLPSSQLTEKDTAAPCFNVALLLPFNLDHATEIQDTTSEEPVMTINPSSLTALEFYEGAVMAWDSLKKKNFEGKLFIYNVTEDSAEMVQLLAKKELKKMDLIIGPFSQQSIFTTNRFCRQEKINIVVPILFSSNILLGNPYSSLAIPSVKTQCEEAISKLLNKPDFQKANYIIMNNNAPKEKELTAIFKNKIQKAGIGSKEINLGKQNLNSMEAGLSASLKNIIIISSSNEAFATEVMNKLNGYREKYNITVIGLPTWENFQTLDFELLQNLNAHIFSSAYINYPNENIRNFRYKFRELYKTEPSISAYQGFDFMFYYLNTLLNFGNKMHENLPIARYSGLHTEYDFIKTGETNGTENRAVFILKYENYQLNPVLH